MVQYNSLKDYRSPEHQEGLRMRLIKHIMTTGVSIAALAKMIDITRPTLTSFLDGEDGRLPTIIRVMDYLTRNNL